MTRRLSRHLRVAHAALASASISLAFVPVALVGQQSDAPVEVALRAPRFLRGVGPSAAPIDPADIPTLRQRVALPTGEMTLDAALDTIARQTGAHLRYSRDVVPLDTRLRLEGGRISLAAALTEVLLEANAGVDVAVTGTDQFVLVKRRRAAAAERGGVVLGRVTDAKTTRALSNAEVFLEGTPWRTTSDTAGRYRLAEIEAGTYTLTVRRLGYAKHSQQIAVRAEQEDTVDIALTPAAVKLDELVTTATGKQRRRDLGNDITTIRADSVLSAAPIRNLSDLLEHRVPGLYTQHTSGAPGDPSRWRLRGLGSAFRSNDPVVIVDGMRIYSAQSEARSGNLANSSVPAPSPLDQIDPNIIETIEVFKGPSAATLYGADAANGVIVITTKKGKPGPAQWNVGFSHGRTDTPGRWPVGYYRFGKVPLVGGYTTFCPLVESRCEVDSLVRYQALNDPEATVLGRGHANTLSLGASGGTSVLRYNITGTYGDEVGLLTLPDFEAARFRAHFNRAAPDWMRHPHRLQTWGVSSNISATLGKTMDVGLLTTISRSEQRRTSLEQKLPALAGTYLDRVNGFYYTPEPVGAGSTYHLSPNTDFINEYYRQTTASSLTVNAGLNAGWRPTSWFSASGQAGLNVVPRADEYFLASTLTAAPADSGALNRASGRSITSTFQVGGQLHKPLRWGMVFETSIGVNYTSLSTLDQTTSALGIVPGTRTLAGAKTIVAADGRTNSSVFGWYLEPRITGQRLSLSTGIRLDGGNAYGTRVTSLLGLPKLNGSWVVSEEPWFPFKAFVSSLRLRGAYGQAQVQPNIADRLRFYVPGTDVISWTPYQIRESLELTGLGNTKLRPERSTEFEGGFDADLLDSRVSVQLTAYRKMQVDALMPVTLPPSVNGGASAMTNIGKIRNTGVELTVGVTPVQTRGLTWSTQLRYWRNNNVVIDLGPSVDPNPLTGLVEGYPLQSRWAYPIVGFADANGNGTLDRSEVQVGDSMVFMGRPMPAYQTTLSTNIVLFGGAVGVTADLSYDAGATQVDRTARNNWVLARPLVDSSTSLIDQAAFLVLDKTDYGLTEDVSTFRVNAISVNYRAPRRITRVLGARELTVGLQGGNLALHSSYRGKDPNVTAWSAGDVIADTGQLPMPRTWQLSFRLQY